MLQRKSPRSHLALNCKGKCNGVAEARSRSTVSDL
jgi:hypothetical protein